MNKNNKQSVDTDMIAHILLENYKAELSKEDKINGYRRYLQRNKNNSSPNKGK